MLQNDLGLETPKRAAIYSRISQDRMGNELGVERQEEYCRRWAADNGWPVVRVYRDNSKSAYKENVVREQYEQLKNDIENGYIDGLIFWDIDRLTRQPDQLGWWLRATRTYGLLMAEGKGGPMALDTRSPMGIYFLRNRADMAEYEAGHKGERQVASNYARAKKGMLFTGARPLGYRRERGKVVIVEDEARVVRAVYAAFLRGVSLDAIARALSGKPDPGCADIPRCPRPAHIKALEYNEAHPENPHDLTDPKYADGDWHSATVRLMLRNPKYAAYVAYTPSAKGNKKKGGDGSAKWYGTLMRDDEGNPVDAQWEPIIDRDTWWDAQDRLNDSQRRTNMNYPRRKRLGSGLFRCGVCGHTLHCEGAKGGSYVCPNREHGKPGHICAMVRYVDPFVEKVIVDVLSRPDVREAIRSRAGSVRPSRDFAAEIEAQQRLIEEGERDYAAGYVTGADLAARRDAANRRIESIRRDQRRAEREYSPEPPALFSLRDVEPAQAFTDADIDTKRAVIDFLCTVKINPVTKRGGTVKGKHGGWFDYERITFEWKTGVQPENIGV